MNPHISIPAPERAAIRAARRRRALYVAIFFAVCVVLCVLASIQHGVGPDGWALVAVLAAFPTAYAAARAV